MIKNLEQKQKKWFWLLVLALLGYTVKNIFVGADVDEGYGIVLGYRLLRGDRLLLELWEPHQTSGIFMALLMAPFLGIVGDAMTCLNIYLRVMYFVIHGLLAMGVYRTVSVCFADLGKLTAALLAVFFYVTSPKCIYIPEYSNLQVWFTTGVVLCFLWYYCDTSHRKGQQWLLVLGGIFLTCDVLAYPSMAFLYFVVLGCVIWNHSVQKAEKNRRSLLRDICLLTLPCVLGAILFMGYLLSYMNVQQIGLVLPHILGEGSHQTDWNHKLTVWLRDLKMVVLLVVVGGVLAAGITWIQHFLFRKQKEKASLGNDFWLSFFIIQTGFQVFYWIKGDDAIAYPQVNYLLLTLLGIDCYFRTNKKQKCGMSMILIALFGYLLVALLSNWGPNNLNPYLIMGALGGVICWNGRMESGCPEVGKKRIQILLMIVIFGNAFGYSYRMIGGDAMNASILDVRGYNHAGPRAGILTNYMTSHRYNVNLENWSQMIPRGGNLLYVGSSQFSYLFGKNVIASGNTISTPTYDETMLDYWEMNPDRYPDVVAVESMYGQITAVEPGNFILQWLEEEFCATEIVEYPYVIVYIR